MLVPVQAIELFLALVVVSGVGLLLYVVFHRDAPNDTMDRLGTETPCPRCRHRNPTHANFCARCGLRLE